MIKPNLDYAPEPLFTVKDVAKLLQISEKTVYKQQNKLGGFYPAGLKLLRFNRETIYGHMEGQKQEGLVLQVRVPGQTVWQPRLCNQKGSSSSQRRSAKRNDPAADRNRHGIFPSDQ